MSLRVHLQKIFGVSWSGQKNLTELLIEFFDFGLEFSEIFSIYSELLYVFSKISPVSFGDYPTLHRPVDLQSKLQYLRSEYLRRHSTVK